MKLLQILAINVRFYRMQQNISQEELSFRSNLHRTYVSAVENCRKNISIENIEKIAYGLGIEPYLLLVKKSK